VCYDIFSSLWSLERKFNSLITGCLFRHHVCSFVTLYSGVTENPCKRYMFVSSVEKVNNIIGYFIIFFRVLDTYYLLVITLLAYCVLSKLVSTLKELLSNLPC